MRGRDSLANVFGWAEINFTENLNGDICANSLYEFNKIFTVANHKCYDQNFTVATRFKSMFGWLVADGWCWFVLREEYCWLVAGG
jgi:hypothetical protein